MMMAHFKVIISEMSPSPRTSCARPIANLCWVICSPSSLSRPKSSTSPSTSMGASDWPRPLLKEWSIPLVKKEKPKRSEHLTWQNLYCMEDCGAHPININDPNIMNWHEYIIMMIVSNDEENFILSTEDPPNMAILDSGRPRTMHGKFWTDQMEKELLPWSLFIKEVEEPNLQGHRWKDWIQACPLSVSSLWASIKFIKWSIPPRHQASRLYYWTVCGGIGNYNQLDRSDHLLPRD